MIIQLIYITDYIRPICLPSVNESDHVDDTALIAGWGKISDGRQLKEIYSIETKINLILSCNAGINYSY